MPFISPSIAPIKTPNKLKYVNGDLGFLKHPEWKHEVLGQIKGQNVVKIAKSNPMQDTVHFHVVDPKTNDVHMQLQGVISPSEPHAFRIGWLEGRHSPVKAHELYDFLLRKGHVSQLETQEQSPGGARVWQKLARRRNINVYGLKYNGYNAETGKEYTPVNVDLSNDNDYYNDKIESGYIKDSEENWPKRKKFANASYGEADHEYGKKVINLYASYHPHVLREAVQAIREMMTLNKLPVAQEIRRYPADSRDIVNKYYPNTQRLGAGLYGSVYDRGKQDSVVKVYHFDPERETGGYHRFIEHAKANQDDPHMPRIYAHKIIHQRAYGIAAVRMEKLQPAFGNNYEHPHLRDIAGSDPNRILDKLRRAGDSAKSLHDSFQKLTAHPKAPKYYDLHSMNVMQRPDKTLVITDPWVG